jgi:hypothetical protein
MASRSRAFRRPLRKGDAGDHFAYNSFVDSPMTDHESTLEAHSEALVGTKPRVDWESRRPLGNAHSRSAPWRS